MKEFFIDQLKITIAAIGAIVVDCLIWGNA